MVITVVKKKQFWVVITVVEEGQFWAVIYMVIKKRQF